MTPQEKELMTDLFNVVKGLSRKVRIQEDIIERIIQMHPERFSVDLLVKIETNNSKMSDDSLANIEKRLNNL